LPKSDGQHLNRLIEAMFQVDGDGRLTGDAPALYVLRTREAVFCRTHAEVNPSCAARLEDIARRSRGRPRDWAGEYAAYAAALSALGSITRIRAGLLYGFPDEMQTDERCIPIGLANVALLDGALREWASDAEAGVPMAGVIVDGRVASLCASVRVSPFAHCAGVETSPDHRGLGFGPLAVAGWAEMVRALGAEPYYATTFDNLASQGVARRLALNLLGSEFSVEIEKP
jgi:hypothetical protein